MTNLTPGQLVTEETERVPLLAFKDWKKRKTIPVFEIKAKANHTSIDLNLFTIINESGWNPYDKLRLWLTETSGRETAPGRLFVRKLDREEDALCLCTISQDGRVTLLGNDEDYTENFFAKAFVITAPS